jgi:lipoprotein-releasing system ATP-binding protein
MAEADNTLVLEDVVKRYEGAGQGVTVLDGVALSVAAGETVAIVGPSGSGKSTLLNIIGSLDQPTSGKVTLGATDVTALKDRELAEFRATRVGFVFQDHHLLPQLTAFENVLVPALAVGRASAAAAPARGLLERIGLSPRMNAFPAQLSGGERQRVATARALVNGAKLLLCDEPTGNLDRMSAAEVVQLLLDVAAGEGVTVLMVTHNLDLAGRFARCLELKQGQLVPARL